MDPGYCKRLPGMNFIQICLFYTLKKFYLSGIKTRTWKPLSSYKNTDMHYWSSYKKENPISNNKHLKQ